MVEVEQKSASGEEAQPDVAEWLDLYGDALYRFAKSRVRDHTLAEDLVQDTFLAGIKAFKDFEGRSNVKTWLVSILRNKIIDHFRKSARRGKEVELEEELGDPPAGMNKLGVWSVYVPNWASSPDDDLESREFMQALDSCFAGLPERSSQALQLKLRGELSTDEICNVLDISTSNYWVVIHRARMALRTCLEKNWYGKR